MDAFKKGYRSVELDQADRAMLEYVEKVTLTPAETVEDDISALREAGFEDRAILDINQITGFFAWCNRTIDGLGVQLEDYWAERATPLGGTPPPVENTPPDE